VLNRIVVEELEAWFFGDIEALATAYRAFLQTSARKPIIGIPTLSVGGTWEALERVLQRAGYFGGGLSKIEVARKWRST